MGNSQQSQGGNLTGKTITVGRVTCKVKKLIAEGGYSFIYRVECESDKTPYVLKQMRCARDNSSARASAQRDIDMHANIIPPHPNIVRCVSHCQREVGPQRIDYLILMEWCGGGSVFELMELRRQERNQLKTREVAEIFRDCCLALSHLHSLTPPVAHRDLKVENLLHDDENRIFKLCDFGSCTTEVVNTAAMDRADRNRIEEDISKNTTLAYRAPEMIDLYQENIINEKADVWSLGCLLFKLCFNRTPFEDYSGNVERMGIMNAKYSVPAQHQFSERLISLMCLCLTPDPSERPSSKQVLNMIDLLLSNETFDWSRDQDLNVNFENEDKVDEGSVEKFTFANGEKELANSVGEWQSKGGSAVDSAVSGRNSGNKGKSTSRSKSTSHVAYKPSVHRGGATSPLFKEDYSQTPKHTSSNDYFFPVDDSENFFLGGKNSSVVHNNIPNAGPSFDQILVEKKHEPDTSTFISHDSDLEKKKSNSWASIELEPPSRIEPFEGLSTPIHTSSPQHSAALHPIDASSFDAGAGRGSTIGKIADSMKRARLRLVKGGNSKQLWVHRATSMKPCAPKSKYVRKLIIDAWETGSLSGWHKHVAHRPLATHQIVALKALVVWLKLMQQGPPEVAVTDAIRGMEIIEDLQKNWAACMSNPQMPVLAMIIHRFAVFLIVKFHFHSQHPHFDAHFSRKVSSTWESATASSWEAQVNIVSRFLTMIGTLDQLQQMVLAILDQAKAGNDDVCVAEKTASACLLPLTCEIFSLVRGAAYVMEEMRNAIEGNDSRKSLFNALSLQFGEQREAVCVCFCRVETLPCVVDFIDLESMKALPQILPIEQIVDETLNMDIFASEKSSKVTSCAPLTAFLSKDYVSFEEARNHSHLSLFHEEEEEEEDENNQEYASFSGFSNPDVEFPSFSQTETTANDDNKFGVATVFSVIGGTSLDSKGDTTSPFGSWISDKNGAEEKKAKTDKQQADNKAVQSIDFNPFATPNLPNVLRSTSPSSNNHARKHAQVKALKKLRENIRLSGIEIDYSEISLKEQIGNGAFAVVHRGIYRGFEVAIKRLKMDQVNERSVTDFHTELAVMESLRHPNIVQAKGACIEPVCLVTEFCSNGSLFDVLHNQDIELTWRLKLKLAYDAARGMNFLHTHTPIIIHRDLKSLNLIIDSNWNLKVSDFGLSRFKVPTMMTGQCGTYQWMAPEVVGGHRYTESADVYSFGINLWEICTRKIPYAHLSPLQAAIAVMKEGLRPDLPNNIPLDYADLVNDCWAQNPLDRPSFATILLRFGKMAV